MTNDECPIHLTMAIGCNSNGKLWSDKPYVIRYVIDNINNSSIWWSGLTDFPGRIILFELKLSTVLNNSNIWVWIYNSEYGKIKFRQIYSRINKFRIFSWFLKEINFGSHKYMYLHRHASFTNTLWFREM